MAKLPAVSDLGRRKAPQPAGGLSQYRVDVNADAPPRAALGAADVLENAAENIERRRKQVAHEARIEQDRLDTTRAEQAFNELRQSQLDLTAGEANGFMRQKGSAAVARSTPLYDDWQKKFDDSATKIGSTLINDAQRQKFNARRDVAKLQFSEELLRHTANEGAVYDKEVYEGTVATEVQNAQARWENQSDVALSIDRITNSVANRAETLKWPAEYKQATLQQELGKVHAGVIQQAIVANKTAYAEAWFNKYRGDIDANTARVLERAVEDGGQKQLTNDYTAEMLAMRDNHAGLEKLAARVLQDPVYRDDLKNMTYGRIVSRAETLERRAAARAAAQERQVQHAITGINQNTLAGFEATTEQMAPVIAAAKGNPALQAQAQQMVNLANATRTFRQAPLYAQEQMLTEMEVQARRDPTRFDLTTLNAMRSIHEAQKRQVNDDPVGFAVKQGIVEPAPLDLSDPVASADGLRQRFAVGRGLRDTQAAPFKPLTPDEVTLVTSALKRVGPEGKREYFGKLMEASNGDLEGYSAIMSQLAPDDPVTAVAGAYAGRGRNVAADLMLKGQAILNPPRATDGQPEKGKTWPMPPDAKLFEEFTSYEQDAFAGRPQLRSTYLQSAKAIYAARSAEAGDATGELNSERWDEAMRLATGGIDKYNGRSTLMPYGYDLTEFKDSLDRRIKMIVRVSESPSPTDNFEASLPAAERNIVNYHRQVEQSGKSGRTPDGRRVTVMSTGITIQEGPNHGKFVSVPGFVDGKVITDEGELWRRWKGDILAGKWPIYDTPEQLNERSRQIHTIMEYQGQGRLAPGMTEDKLQDMPLEPIGDGRYVFKAGDGILVDRANRPVIVDFNLNGAGGGDDGSAAPVSPLPAREDPLDAELRSIKARKQEIKDRLQQIDQELGR